MRSASRCRPSVHRPKPRCAGSSATADVAEAAAAITQAARWARDATEICRKIRGFIGKAPTKCVDFAAADAVHAALFLIAPEAAARNVRVESQIDADARLFADPVQVQQVLANLLMNGIQAIESGSSHERTLTVSAKLSGAEVMFDVCDTGPGIEQQSIDQLFEPFFTSKSDGMGMGLTVARSIVDAHHGRIWARGEPGAGCCFVRPAGPSAHDRPGRMTIAACRVMSPVARRSPRTCARDRQATMHSSCASRTRDAA